MPFDFSPELKQQILEAFQASQQQPPELPILPEQESALAYINGLFNPQPEQSNQPPPQQPEVPNMPQVYPQTLQMLLPQSQPTQQSRERPTEYPTEPLKSVNDQISEGVLHAAQQPRNIANDNRVPSIQLERTYQPPNPYEVLAGNSLINLKNYNELAADGGAGDALRQGTNNIANMIRDVASANDIDLSAYGSDVTAADAAKYHDSKRLRDIMETISPEGQYYRTADQYYNDKVMEAYFAGASPRQARKAASMLAQEYQARRVAYLRGVYSSYGHDANGTNDVGADTLGMLAQENPMLANYYAQIYPVPKEVINRRQTLEDKALDQNNTFARLGLLHGYDIDNSVIQHTLSELGKNNDVTRDQIKYQFKNDSDFFNYYREKGIDFSMFKGQQTFLQRLKEAEPTTVEKIWDEANQIAEIRGLKGDQAKAFAAEYTQYAIMGQYAKGYGKNKSSTNGSTEQKFSDLTGLRNSLVSEAKALRDSLSKDFEATPEEKEQITKRIKEIDQQIATINSMQSEMMAGGAQIVFQGKDHEREDLAIVNQIWAETKGRFPDEQIKQKIYQLVIEHTGDEEYAKKLAGIGM